MSDLYVYTLFGSSFNKPRCTGIKAGNTFIIYDLYRPGAHKTIAFIDQQKKIIRDIIVGASKAGHRVIISDFKNHISAFDIPITAKKYNVYDIQLPDISASDSIERDHQIVTMVMDKVVKCRIYEYQKLVSNAAIVYQDLQNRGLTNNCVPVYPIWCQKTYSGRSKTTGFNIQGFTDNHCVVPPGFGDKSVLLHFDWICADIRVAAIMANDAKLISSFAESDPYTVMMNIINEESDVKITRDECKIFLLKSINSMDFGSDALSRIYIGLGKWINRCYNDINHGTGQLETLLNRKFKLSNAKNHLAVLNGAMQGSVAHGMHNIMRIIWEKMGNKMVAEVHDSLVMASSSDIGDIKSTIDNVASIMIRPFAGLLNDNHVFPLKVSIGRKWRKWRLYATYRDTGVVYVKNGDSEKTLDEGPESCREEIGESQEIEEIVG